MIAIEVRFPLGTYHAVSSASFGTPEWPPHPVRLLGALLAAAHEAPGVDADAARAAIRRLAEASPPVIVADGDLPKLRGASRWAPRNHAASELSGGVSPRDVGRGRTAVHKGGVVVGRRPVAFWWKDVDLDAASARVLDDLVSELSFLGTSRSPVIGRVSTAAPAEAADRWEPVPEDEDSGDASVRVPDATLVDAFDVRHEARRAPERKPVDTSGHVPAVAIGRTVPYALRSRRRRRSERAAVDPRHWADMLILALDPGGAPGGSDLRPKAPAAYLLARAFRAALLGAYATPGMPEDAPPILRGRDAEPHVAIVPLPFVGDIPRRVQRPDGTVVERTIAADGIVRGIAVVFPHESRVPDLAEQRLRVEAGLRTFVLDGDRRWIDIPGAGRVFLRLPAPGREVLRTLTEDRYRKPHRTWESVVPVVHSRHRTSKGPSGVYRQVAADCRDVGLPDPERVEILDRPAIGGAAARLTLAGLPADHAWRNLIGGNRSHVRITFARPVAGPVLLGRARHFGSGLCLPVADRPPAS